jgi:outer membrane protein assembly factor BamE (lipoprotein component of BamABCDE complex)
MRHLANMIAAACCLLLLAGCDREGKPIEQFGLDRLARGVSTEAEVRMVMGAPDTVREEPDGSRTLEFPKGPSGHRTWMFVIGKDGKLSDYRQVLTEEVFATVNSSMSRDDVRRLLGKPRSVMQFKQKNEEVWEWLYLDGNKPRAFNVHFDIGTGKVRRTSSSDESHQLG